MNEPRAWPQPSNPDDEHYEQECSETPPSVGQLRWLRRLKEDGPDDYGVYLLVGTHVNSNSARVWQALVLAPSPVVEIDNESAGGIKEMDAAWLLHYTEPKPWNA